MKFNRKKVFDGVKARIDATLNQSQVDGLEFLLTSFENEPLWSDVRHIAYALATTFHETAGSFQPVEEGYYLGSKARVKAFQKTLRYYPYFGRGFVQLTWETAKIPNYSKAGKALGIDFVKNPDLVMQPKNAFEIMTRGMFAGWFTGKKLSTYISGSKCDYANARRIINGMDKAGMIAGYARSFETILRASISEAHPPKPANKPPIIKPIDEPIIETPPIHTDGNASVEIINGNIKAETNTTAPPNVIIEKELPPQEEKPTSVLGTLKAKVASALAGIGGGAVAIEQAKQAQTLGISNETWNTIFWLILAGVVIWVLYYFVTMKVIPWVKWVMSRLRTQSLVTANTAEGNTVEIMGGLTDERIAELTKQGYVVIRRR